MKTETALNLRKSLKAIDDARDNLINAEEENVPAAAHEYMKVRAEATGDLDLASIEYERERAGAAETETPETPSGAPIVKTDETVTPANVGELGEFGHFRAKGDASAPIVEASEFAVAGGTAVVTEAGEVGAPAASRIIRTQAAPPEEGATLTVVLDDVFSGTYEKADPAEAPEAADIPAEAVEPPAAEPQTPAAPAEPSAPPPGEAGSVAPAEEGGEPTPADPTPPAEEPPAEAEAPDGGGA